ncbi:MAG: metallophosphoesterase [Candidatus Nanohaloarchaea archaeon]
MKIAVISDIHSNYEALLSVMDHIEQKEVQNIFCCGDLIGYNSRPNEVIELLKEKDVQSVRGNHDDALFTGAANFNPVAKECLEVNREILTNENLEYLKDLNQIATHEMNDKDIVQVHGSPRDPINAYIYEESINESFIEDQGITQDVILMGQTHKPYVKEVQGKLFVNPGSVGQPRDGDPRAAYALIDLEKEQVSIIRREYDVDATVENNKDVGMPDGVGERLYKGI